MFSKGEVAIIERRSAIHGCGTGNNIWFVGISGRTITAWLQKEEAQFVMEAINEKIRKENSDTC
jgi:hypothetical protein